MFSWEGNKRRKEGWREEMVIKAVGWFDIAYSSVLLLSGICSFRPEHGGGGWERGSSPLAYSIFRFRSHTHTHIYI